ncbi:MAG: YeeE/YedE family protein [Bryobacteraceae bacterium]|nr:YeeE/YedE family protein [Bryobacteraceae bacterium]
MCAHGHRERACRERRAHAAAASGPGGFRGSADKICHVNPLRRPSWSPYAAGAAIGVLSWVAFLTAGRPLGVSSAFVRLAAWIEGLIAPAHVEATPYLARLRPVLDWEFFLVAGIGLGALAASRLGEVRRQERPPAKRIAEAAIGGFFLMIGARLANGCTSGNGISGSLQLALSGWVFFLTIFVSGAAAAMLFRREAR